MFLCQRDPFLKECKTNVVSCNEVQNVGSVLEEFKIEKPADPKKLFELILEDSVLFPEGGGQPDDRGFVENIPVSRVIRRGNQAVHYVSIDPESIFHEKQQVSVKLAWDRRFDHMQQHSGQHLITAVADKRFGFQTTSWYLGPQESYIELDTKEISEEQMTEIENEVNMKIRKNSPVTVEVVGLESEKLKTARGRNLPDDVKKDIRIVTMEGIESNVCCGTHVSSLSLLQVIKLLFWEKKKGKCLLHFVVGNRVLSTLGETFNREQKLVQILRSCPAELPTVAENLSVALKMSRKCSLILGRDLASLEAKMFSDKEDDGQLWHYHRDNVELDFATAFFRELKQTEKSIVLVTIKTDGNSGCFLLRGSTEVPDQSKLGDQLCTVLDGKGSLRGNVYQAKVSKMNALNKALKVAQEFVVNNINKTKV